MRRSWIALAMLALTCCAGVGASVALAQEAAPAYEQRIITPLDESCATGNVCYWSQPEYQGSKSFVSCTGGIHTTSFEAESAKNRCANKASRFLRNGTFIRCVNANENEKFNAGITEKQILKEGENC